jgi:hypothetical protein
MNPRNPGNQGDAPKAPPHDLKMEQAVLGCMMLEAAAVERVRQILSPTDFYRLAHRDIYQACLEAYDSGSGADLLIVKSRLLEKGKLRKVGGVAYLAECLEAPSTSVNAAYYANKVKESAQRRALCDLARTLSQACDLQVALPDLIAQMRAVTETMTVSARGDGSELVCLRDVEPKPVAWLWPGRIPLGKLTLLVGDPGLGKSLVSLDLAARVTTGTPWPDAPGQRQDAGDVLILSAEDDLADTIRPRLDAAGADPARVVALQAVKDETDDGGICKRAFNLTRDVGQLAQATEVHPGIRLVIIDPISAYMGDVDSHHNAEVRAALSPLADFAQQHRVAVLAISHLRKSGGRAIYRTMGSLAFAAAARTVLGVGVDPQDDTGQRRLMLPIKANLTADSSGMAWTIVPKALNGLGELPRIAWERDPVPAGDVDSLLGGEDEDGKRGPDAYARGEAVEFLKQELAAGPRSAKEMESAAKQAGVASRTLDRAKALLRVQATHEPDGWYWTLPEGYQ